MQDQDKFDEIVNKAKGPKCFIKKALSGEISLSSLKDKGMDELHFADGGITQIHNVPRGLKKLVISNNKLDSIPSKELRDLVDLEASNNMIEKLDLKDMVNLDTLDVENNLIVSITHIPKSLKSLNINNNRLKELDLGGCESCVAVSTLDNHSLQKIVNAPVTNPDFELKKDAHTQLSVSHKKSSIKTNNDVDQGVKEAVDEYYALKNKYTLEKKAQIKEIMENEKHNRIKKVRNAVFKCVNCKKLGGTKFWKDSDNNLRAVCGNTSSPCNLNISILSSLTLTQKEIDDDLVAIEDAKQEIIKLKMDTLFNYVDGDSSIKIFNKLIGIVNDDAKNAILHESLSSYDSIVNNSEKMRIISKKMQDVYSEMSLIRKLKSEYSHTNNKELLGEIAASHKNIKKSLDAIRAIKYPVAEIVEDGESMVLKQLPYSPAELLNPNWELLKVNKFLR
jgi:hypothetical protein